MSKKLEKFVPNSQLEVYFKQNHRAAQMSESLYMVRN